MHPLSKASSSPPRRSFWGYFCQVNLSSQVANFLHTFLPSAVTEYLPQPLGTAGTVLLDWDFSWDNCCNGWRWDRFQNGGTNAFFVCVSLTVKHFRSLALSQWVQPWILQRMTVLLWEWPTPLMKSWCLLLKDACSAYFKGPMSAVGTPQKLTSCDWSTVSYNDPPDSECSQAGLKPLTQANCSPVETTRSKYKPPHTTQLKFPGLQHTA